MRDADRIKEKENVTLTTFQAYFLSISVVVLMVLSFFLGYSLGEGKRPIEKEEEGLIPEDVLNDSLAEILAKEAFADRKTSLPDKEKEKETPGKEGQTEKGVEKPLQMEEKKAVSPVPSSLEKGSPSHEKEERKESPEPSVKKERFAVQVASYNEKEMAENLALRLREEGFQSSVMEAEVSGKTWFRVRIGSFEKKEEAEAEMKKIVEKEPSFSPMITRE